MRNVKVNIQADTTHALGKVRELTGALAQLDAVTKRNVQYLLQALGGAGLNPQAIGSVKTQQTVTAQAQEQVNRTVLNNSSGSQQNTKSKDAIEKLNRGMRDMAEKQFDLFADGFAKAISDAFTNLFTGKFKNVLSGLKNAFQGLFGELLGQLVGEIATTIRKSIAKQFKGLFSGGKSEPSTPVPVITSGRPTGGYSLFGGFGNMFGGGGQGAFNGQNSSSGNFGGQTSFFGQNPFSNNFGAQGNGQSFFSRRNPFSTVNLANQNDVRGGLYSQFGLGNFLPLDFRANPITPTTNGTNVTNPNNNGVDAVNQTTKAASFSWGSFGKLIGSMAPALGSSLGGMLGGPSGVGSIMGSIGGLAGGTAVGLLTGAIGPGLGGSVSFLGASMSVGLASGILAGVAVALMIGAYFLGRNKQRKADEKTRNQAMLDSLGQLDEILKQINRDEIDGPSGVSQANSIRKQYMEQMSQLKDKKTRNIALKDVSRLDSKISLIKQAAESQTARKALDAKLVPTFADGGFVGGAGYKVLGSDGAFMQPFRGRVPGVYDRRDDFLARLTGNEVVLTPDVWMPIAPYLKQKRVPGFADGGRVNEISSVTGSNQTNINQEIIIEELVIHLNNQFGSDTAAKVVGVALKTPDGQQAVVKSVRTHIGENGLGDGLVRDINRVNDRGF